MIFMLNHQNQVQQNIYQIKSTKYQYRSKEINFATLIKQIHKSNVINNKVNYLGQYLSSLSLFTLLYQVFIIVDYSNLFFQSFSFRNIFVPINLKLNIICVYMEQPQEQLQPTFRTIQSKITFQKETITALPQSLITNAFMQSSKNINNTCLKNFQLPEDVAEEFVYNGNSMSRKKLKGTQPRLLCGNKQHFYENLEEYNNKNSLLFEYQKTMLLDLKEYPNRRENRKIIKLRGRPRRDNKENTNISSRGKSNPTDDQSHLKKQKDNNGKIIVKTQPKFLNITLTQSKLPSFSFEKSEFHTPSKEKQRFITDNSHSQRKGIKVFSNQKKQMSLINSSTKKKCNRLSEVYSTSKKHSQIMQKSFTTNILEHKKNKSVIRLYIGGKEQQKSKTRSKVLKPTKNPSASVATSRRIAEQLFLKRMSEIKPDKLTKKLPTRFKMINSISSKINIFHSKV